jgi:hypothetical protein
MNLAKAIRLGLVSLLAVGALTEAMVDMGRGSLAVAQSRARRAAKGKHMSLS